MPGVPRSMVSVRLCELIGEAGGGTEVVVQVR
ncbi:hypothetical protein J2793_002247 [Paraburkholderia caledonica]|uniref:Uncharacterized protein n=1 Tax=Paraburkholderia caledonica TaxID=134536 RepID=A0AB73ICD1_9BURK|nr:hypothetical protein [Paraburkholderia caledonica]